jgi:hypothetical protein
MIEVPSHVIQFFCYLLGLEVLLVNDVCFVVSERVVVISVNLKISPFNTVPNMSALLDEPALAANHFMPGLVLYISSVFRIDQSSYLMSGWDLDFPCHPVCVSHPSMIFWQAVYPYWETL